MWLTIASFALKAALGFASDYILAWLKRSGKERVNELMPVADAAVRNAEALAGLKGEEKRHQAFAEVKAAAIGAEMGDSLVNVAIELAVQRLKSEAGE